MNPEKVFEINGNIFTTDAKLTSALESFEIKNSTVLNNVIPKAVEKVAEMGPISVALHRSPLSVNQGNDNIHRDRDDSMTLIVTNVNESGDSTNGRIARIRWYFESHWN